MNRWVGCLDHSHPFSGKPNELSRRWSDAHRSEQGSWDGGRGGGPEEPCQAHHTLSHLTFIHSCNKYSLSAKYIRSTTTGAEERAANKAFTIKVKSSTALISVYA